MSSITDIVPPGVVTGDNLVKLLEHARDNGYAIPAVNCTRYVLYCIGINKINDRTHLLTLTSSSFIV